MKWKLRRRFVFRAWQGCLFWAWLCKKDNSAFRFHRLTPFYFTRRNVLRPAYGPSNLKNHCCQVDVCFRPATFDGGLASSLEVPMASAPPRTPSLNTDFHDDSSNVSSLGRSATAHIARRSLPDLPLRSKRNPMPPFVNMHQYKESGQLLRFKGCGKS